MAPTGMPERFEWERIMPRYQWEQLIRALPSASPLFGHKYCPKGQCQRRDGSWLHASSVKLVGFALATFANPDGTRAFPGIVRLELACSKSRPTVIKGLRHLETVGLITAQLRAGAIGTARDKATVYCLTSPRLDIYASAPDSEEAARAYAWFSKRADPDPDPDPGPFVPAR